MGGWGAQTKWNTTSLVRRLKQACVIRLLIQEINLTSRFLEPCEAAELEELPGVLETLTEKHRGFFLFIYLVPH